MASWTIEFARSFHRDARRIPAEIMGRLEAVLDGLEEDPFPHGAIKLAGEHNQYRIRLGDYRFIYEVFPRERLIVALRIGPRGGVYK